MTPPGPRRVNRSAELDWSGVQRPLDHLVHADHGDAEVPGAIRRPPYDVGPDIAGPPACRAVTEASTGTAMRRNGLTEPDHLDPRSDPEGR